MASRRKCKRPLPDWVGVTYNGKNKDGDKAERVNDKKTTQDQTVKLKNSDGTTSYSQTTNSKTVYPSSSKHNKRENQGEGQNNARKAQSDYEDILRLSLPLLKFEGKLVYSFNTADCSLLCDDILSSMAPSEVLHAGFDMEWPVTYSSAEGSDKTALIQLCTVADACYLFHISAMGGLPKRLKALLSDQRLIKYGINIESDFWKLERDFDIPVRNIIRDSVRDLTPIANAKLKSTERWTLDGLTRNVLHQRLDKEREVRCGKWDQYPLTEQQIEYAAADAYAAFLLAQRFLDKL